MRISISNLAWEPSDDAAVAGLLIGRQVDAIDVAPGKYFPDPATVDLERLKLVRGWWEDRGISITGMQALLFGTSGLNLFGPPSVRSAMLDHLVSICRIGAALGARKLVFGSPRNRDRSGLSDEAAQDIAITFFRRLGDIAGDHQVEICLEPNPTCYGANFMTTSAETARVVRAISHPAIRMQLDTGALLTNNESPTQIITEFKNLIGHVHISAPQLVPISDYEAPLSAIGQELATELPEQVAAIEMLAPKGDNRLETIDRALECAIHHFRGRSVPSEIAT